RQAAADNIANVRGHLGAAVNANFGKFEALNAALWQDGVLVFVPKGVTITEPVHLLRRGSADEGWWYGRTLIIAEEDSAITVMDEYFSASDDVAGKSNHVVEVIAGAASDVHYVTLQRNNLNSLSYQTQRSVIGDRATVTLVAATLGANTHKANLGSFVRGHHAKSLQYGLVFGSGSQRLDHHTEHIHQGPNGYSNLDFKVVLKDKAKSAYTGLIRVDEHIENCEAYQSNRNLLLNRGASAESIPELEIMCDEVVCTHGATVGPIDEMQVFYLMNRGISRTEAVKMIVRGHVEPTLALLPDTFQPRIREYVEQRLESL
ncbi:MAG TPA: Fe-S cluster assembly protein SufD, partial [candidate division Zixibacteria bacterium]|nr:Fe-S cluster assembly protein SufD [candidate division Zixibacteria bacterium]